MDLQHITYCFKSEKCFTQQEPRHILQIIIMQSEFTHPKPGIAPYNTAAKQRQSQRKEQMHQLRKEKFREQVLQFEREERQNFDKFTSTLCFANLLQRLPLVEKYATSEEFSPQMLRHTDMLVEALAQLVDNQQMALLLLNVLGSLSSYEEYQMPGDEQTAKLMNTLMDRFPRETLALLRNISGGKTVYSYGEMFTYMIEGGFIYKIAQVLEKIPGSHKQAVSVLCGMGKEQPLFQLPILRSLFELIKKASHTQNLEIKFEVATLLCSFNSLRQLPEVAELLLTMFAEESVAMFKEFPYEMTSFTRYLLRHPTLHNRIPKKMISALEPLCTVGEFQQQALNVLNIYCQNFSAAELFGETFLVRLVQNYPKSTISVKQCILEAIMKSTEDRNVYGVYFDGRFVALTIERLQSEIIEDVLKALQMLINIYSLLDSEEERARFLSPFKAHLEEMACRPNLNKEVANVLSQFQSMK